MFLLMIASAFAGPMDTLKESVNDGEAMSFVCPGLGPVGAKIKALGLPIPGLESLDRMAEVGFDMGKPFSGTMGDTMTLHLPFVGDAAAITEQYGEPNEQGAWAMPKGMMAVLDGEELVVKMDPPKNAGPLSRMGGESTPHPEVLEGISSDDACVFYFGNKNKDEEDVALGLRIPLKGSLVKLNMVGGDQEGMKILKAKSAKRPMVRTSEAPTMVASIDVPLADLVSAVGENASKNDRAAVMMDTLSSLQAVDDAVGLDGGMMVGMFGRKPMRMTMVAPVKGGKSAKTIDKAMKKKMKGVSGFQRSAKGEYLLDTGKEVLNIKARDGQLLMAAATDDLQMLQAGEGGEWVPESMLDIHDRFPVAFHMLSEQGGQQLKFAGGMGATGDVVNMELDVALPPGLMPMIIGMVMSQKDAIMQQMNSEK